MYNSFEQLKEAGRAYARENYSECLRMCGQALDAINDDDPNKALFLHLLADVYSDLEEYEKAIEVLGRIIAVLPSSVALCNRAWAFRELKQFDKSIIDYQDALRLDPYNIVAEKNLAECLLASENSSAVIVLLKRHVDNKKQYADIYRILGDAFVKEKQIEDAYIAYCSAYCLNSDDEHSKNSKQQIERAFENK